MSRRHWQIAAVTATVLTLAAAVLVAVLERPAPAATPEQYCRDEASENVPRCPPEPGTYVLGIWKDGRMASMKWTGTIWILDVPVQGTATVSLRPHDWRER